MKLDFTQIARNAEAAHKERVASHPDGETGVLFDKLAESISGMAGDADSRINKEVIYGKRLNQLRSMLNEDDTGFGNALRKELKARIEEKAGKNTTQLQGVRSSNIAEVNLKTYTESMFRLACMWAAANPKQFDAARKLYKGDAGVRMIHMLWKKEHDKKAKDYPKMSAEQRKIVADDDDLYDAGELLAAENRLAKRKPKAKTTPVVPDSVEVKEILKALRKRLDKAKLIELAEAITEEIEQK